MATTTESLGAEKLLELWFETRGMTFRDQLVAHHLPLVYRLCRRFQHQGEPMDELIRVGAIGLVKAIDDYDPQRDNSLTTVAIDTILAEIKSYLRDQGWAVKLPAKLQRQKMLLDRTVDTLTESLGRSPHLAEIGEAANLSQEEVIETLEVNQSPHTLLPKADLVTNPGQEYTTTLTSKTRDVSEREYLAYDADRNVPFAEVDPREQIVLYLKLYSGLCQNAIARRLGISQLHVFHLQQSAAAKLRLRLRSCAAL